MAKFWRLIAIVALTAGIVYLPAQEPACACSCAQATKDEYFARADTVFTGIATKFERSERASVASSDDPVWYTFDVEQAEKGSPGAETVISTAMMGPSCGAKFQLGMRYRVYVDKGQTSLCSGNEELGLAYETPQTVTIRTAPLAPESSIDFGVIGVTVSVLLAVVIGFFAYRKYRNRAAT